MIPTCQIVLLVMIFVVEALDQEHYLVSSVLDPLRFTSFECKQLIDADCLDCVNTKITLLQSLVGNPSSFITEYHVCAFAL